MTGNAQSRTSQVVSDSSEAACAFCGVAIGKETFASEEVVYCCQGCHRRAKELAAAHGRLQQAYWDTLHVIVGALDARESKTAAHSRRVAEITRVLARAMSCTQAQEEDIYRGALLHDIGKIGIPDDILLKPGALTEDEWKIMRLHSEIGYQMLYEIDFLRPAAEIVRAHQERFDGRGYPHQLRGEQIPLGARLFALADALDAITTDRPYRAAQDVGIARRKIQRGSGSQFDPAIVELFERNLPAIETVVRGGGRLQ